MIVYYVLFGLFSALALSANLLFLVALLSLLQATLTLPGMAAIALTLGMAIDANVLINERIREELRGGATPQAAIAEEFAGCKILAQRQARRGFWIVRPQHESEPITSVSDDELSGLTRSLILRARADFRL